MDLIKAAQIVKYNLHKTGLKRNGWGFNYDNSVVRFGLCNPLINTIFLSRYLVHLNNEMEVKDTIYHELAHAIVGCEEDHNEKWKKKTIELGGSGEVCYSSKVMVPPNKFYTYCKVCFWTYYTNRRYKKCERCNVILKWSRSYWPPSLLEIKNFKLPSYLRSSYTEPSLQNTVEPCWFSSRRFD